MAEATARATTPNDHDHCDHDLHWESVVCGVCMQNFAAAHDSLMAALRAVEWQYTYGFADKSCRICKNIEAEGHTAKCTTGLAIVKGEAK